MQHGEVLCSEQNVPYHNPNPLWCVLQTRHSCLLSAQLSTTDNTMSLCCRFVHGMHPPDKPTACTDLQPHPLMLPADRTRLPPGKLPHKAKQMDALAIPATVSHTLEGKAYRKQQPCSNMRPSWVLLQRNVGVVKHINFLHPILGKMLLRDVSVQLD
jgi:hypothetical protein